MDQVNEALHGVFGFRSFRAHQEPVIEALLNKRDVFAVMSTGSGKSLCYQLPTHLLQRMAVVAAPDGAMMRDQVASARETGLRAQFLTGDQSPQERADALAALKARSLDLLYVCPHFLEIEGVGSLVKRAKPGLLVFDEVHSISEWSHDYRPEYHRLAMKLLGFPRLCVAGFSSSATYEVQDDVLALLGMKTPHLVRASFDRPNLFYMISEKERLEEQLLDFIQQHADEAGVIFRNTRRGVEQTAARLEQAGLKVLPYHVGMSKELRSQYRDMFNRDEVKVMVATKVFAEGLDKSNIRYVLFGDLPSSVERFYQDSAHAGLDGAPAYCGLYYSQDDVDQVNGYIDQLEHEGAQKAAVKQLQRMERIAQTPVCRRVGLLEYFGEMMSESNCGMCDICVGKVESVDLTLDARTLLLAIYRSGQQCNMAHIIDILMGRRTEQVLQRNHDQLQTFGVGNDRDAGYWKQLLADLQWQECVRMEEPYSVLTLTARGGHVLSGQQAFTAIRKRIKGAKTFVFDADYCEGLFRALCEKRAELAASEGIAPFILVSDQGLYEMAHDFPTRPEELSRISGFGSNRRVLFGDHFMALIREYIKAHPSCAPQAIQAKRPPRKKTAPQAKGDVYANTLHWIKQGASVEEMSKACGLSCGTIIEHIEKLVADGHTLNVHQFVPSTKVAELEKLFALHGTDGLKTVVRETGGRVSIQEARLVRAFLHYV